MIISKLILALAASAAAAFSHASPLAVINAGFEGPVTTTYTVNGNIDGWTGGNQTGVFMPSSYAPAGTGFIAGVTGFQTVYLNEGSVQQILMSTLTAGTYTLQTRVGARDDVPAPDYIVELMAGATVLESIDSTDFTTIHDGWIDTILTYTSVVSSADNLGIRLRITNQGTQVNFDDVRLDFQAAQSVPEPASLALVSIALIGMGALRWR